MAGIGGVGWIPSRGLTDLLEQSDVHVDVVPDGPFVLGGRLRWSWRGGLAVFAVMAVVALPVKGLFQTTGSSMEEGFMLVFPRLVQQGKIPNVDFLHLYGPGSLDLLALWYWVFGYTLEAERAFGLLQHVGIIFGMYALTRAWGRVAAIGASWITAVLIMTPIGLSALAWHGALALALWSIVFAVRAVCTGRASNWAIAGLLAGIALTFRPDAVLAIGAALLFAVWVHRAAAWKPLLIGAAIGLIPMFVHLVIAGPWNVFEGIFLDPVFRLRAGRELPRPPSWNMIDGALQAAAEGLPPWWRFPALNASKQLFFWFFAVVIIAIAVPADRAGGSAVGATRRRARSSSCRSDSSASASSPRPSNDPTRRTSPGWPSCRGRCSPWRSRRSRCATGRAGCGSPRSAGIVADRAR